MARLTIDLPDELKAQALTRASECGHGSIEAYLEALVRADLVEPEVDDDDLEALLVERLESSDPGIEVTPQFVEHFKQRIERRREAHGGRP